MKIVMMRKDLLLPVNLLYLLILVGFAFSFFMITYDVAALGIPPQVGRALIFVGMISSFIASVVLIIDVFSNDVSGKYLWTVAILFSGGIIGFFYLRSRGHYLKGSN